MKAGNNWAKQFLDRRLCFHGSSSDCCYHFLLILLFVDILHPERQSTSYNVTPHLVNDIHARISALKFFETVHQGFVFTARPFIMAEVLGAVASGITLAALFKACIDAFELIQVGRHQDVDYRKLKLRLNVERCRLFVWGRRWA